MNKGAYEGKVSAKRVDPNVIMNPDAQEEETQPVPQVNQKRAKERLGKFGVENKGMRGGLRNRNRPRFDDMEGDNKDLGNEKTED